MGADAGRINDHGVIVDPRKARWRRSQLSDVYRGSGAFAEPVGPTKGITEIQIPKRRWCGWQPN